MIRFLHFLCRLALRFKDILRYLFDYTKLRYSNLERQAFEKEKARQDEKRLQAKQDFERKIGQWDFDNEFSELVELAEQDHDYLLTEGNQSIKENKFDPKGYAIIQACLECRPKEGHYDVALHALSVGNELISAGKLKEAREFYLSLEKIFPEIYEPYALLYEMLYIKQEEYRNSAEPEKSGEKRKLLFSYPIWGDTYIRFFCDYCIPTMMSAGNLPAVSKIRDILIDIYAHKEDIEKIKQQEVFKNFSNICEVNFIEFPESLINCEGYRSNGGVFRYNIYGGFHHLSIERARAIEADVMCLGPDNLYADGSFLNYVRFIDKGYNAVLFTATRAQAEFLEPVLEKMKDHDKQILTISSDEMVDFSAKYIHHSFLQYIVKDNMTPVWRSGFFIPYEHGFRIRSVHYHPVIISADAIHRSKDIHWTYTPADATLIGALFPDKKDWKKIKVITDSRDGIMLDMAYGSPGMWSQDEVEFNENYLDELMINFNDNHSWNLQFVVDYRMDKEMSSIRAYLYDDSGNLQPHELKLNQVMEDTRKRLDDWYNKKFLDDGDE